MSILENIFDISPVDSRNPIKVPEDCVFLHIQLNAQKLIIFRDDKIFPQHEQNKHHILEINASAVFHFFHFIKTSNHYFGRFKDF